MQQFLKPNVRVELNADGILVANLPTISPGMKANSSFFGHPKWGAKYFELENFSRAFGDRWRAAIGDWDGKIVVDIGCGPGNLFRSVGGSPQKLIGIDISEGALKNAQKLGYIAILADVHETPLISGFADIVTANATLHHCDDMARVLSESARLVKPGGLLITDEDPLQNDTRLRGWGRLVSIARSYLPIARVRDHPNRAWKFSSYREQRYRLQTEIHNKFPGDGIAQETYSEILEPLGFEVSLYPHCHVVGADLLDGNRGDSSMRARLTQRLSGIDPEVTDSGLSVMCVARRKQVTPSKGIADIPD